MSTLEGDENEMHMDDCIVLELHQDYDKVSDGDNVGIELIVETIRARMLVENEWDKLTDERLCTKRRQIDLVVEKSLLAEHSTYYRALSNFREATCRRITVNWNVPAFCTLLKYFYLRSFDVSPSRVATLLETSIFFGVDEAIHQIENWVTLISSSNDAKQIEDVLRNLSNIWNVSKLYGHSLLARFCPNFLAINFVAATSMKAFSNLPYELLKACVNHAQLTIHSEKQLYDALSRWCRERDVFDEVPETMKMREAELMGKVRIFLLPPHGSTACIPPEFPCNWSERIIRITEHLEFLDLSGCYMVTDDILFLSSAKAPVRGSGCQTEDDHPLQPESSARRTVISPSFYRKPDRNTRWLKIPKFEYLTRVDFSQCWNIPEDSLLVWVREACPNLLKLVVANCPQIGVSLLPALAFESPRLKSLDLSLDTIHLKENEIQKTAVDLRTMSRAKRLHFLLWGVYPLDNLKSLSLRGRTELTDQMITTIAVNAPAILDLDLSFCTTLTDDGISSTLKRYPKGLRSLRAKSTGFGCFSCKELITIETNISKCIDLEILDLEGCHGLQEVDIASILQNIRSLTNLCLGDTKLKDSGLSLFRGHRLQDLCLKETKVSATVLATVIKSNPELRRLDIRGCQRACIDDYDDLIGGLERIAQTAEVASSIYKELGYQYLLENLSVGWRFSSFSLDAMQPASKSLKSLTIGVGGTICDSTLEKLVSYWPRLQQLSLCFQVITDDGLIRIMEGFRWLQTLELQNCVHHLSPRGTNALINSCPSSLTTLKLERAVPWMSDSDLLELCRSCTALTNLSLVGCKNMTKKSLLIIAEHLRCLTELRLEECEGMTTNGGQALLESCKGLQRLTLRHNGKGLEDNFVMDAMFKLPYLWYMSLDVCDAVSSKFETPDQVDQGPLSTVLLARCKRPDHAFHPTASKSGESEHTKRYHKDTVVLRWRCDRVQAYTIKKRF